MKKLLALCMAFLLTFQLVTPVFAEEIEETQTATEAVEVETEAPVTETPTTEPPVPETAAPEETSAPAEPQPTTEVTEATETTASTEETTSAATEPTEETTEPTLDLLADSSDYSLQLRRIDELYERIKKNGGFFTVNQKTCGIRTNNSHSSCDNCKMGNVVSSNWFSSEFGSNVTCQQFALNKGGGAWTCYSFAIFASWFVNRGDDSDTVSIASRDPGSFSYDFMINHANPGDYLSIDNHHGAIFISCNDQGVYVLDSNFAAKGEPACQVKKHLIRYSYAEQVTVCHLQSKQGGHTHNYVTESEAAHPHKVYKKCYGCGDWFYTGATVTVADCGQCHPPVQQVYLDLNGYLDGRDTGYLEDYGTCDVYINGVKVADDCTDFYQAYPVGTTYSIKDIRATNGHQYIGEKKVWDQSGNTGVSFDTLSGTLTQNQEVVLEFKSLVYLDLNGYLDGRDFGSLEDYGTCDVYIDGAKAADDCTDFYQVYPVGTTYSIEDIRATNGHQYIGEKADFWDEAGNTGISFGSNLSGTLTKNQEVVLEFKTVSQGGKCGDNLTWALDGSGVLTISGSGDMWDFEQEGSNVAPWIGRKLTKLVLSDKITSIGNYAFYKCTDITGGLVLPSNLKTIGKGAFAYCSGFSGKLVFPETLTEIKAFAFDACSGFSGDLILPDGITAIRALTFNECEGFNGSLKLPKNLKAIEANAFRACHNLTGKLELPETLTELGGVAFGGCNFTGGLRIPGSVSIIGHNAFYHCQGFNGTLEITEGTTVILGYSFVSCIGFTKVILPESITKIGVASFRDMTGLQDVYYAGTAEQWKNINIESENSPLTSANIHCNENVASGACGDKLAWNLNSAGKLTISGTGAMWDYEWCQDGDVVYSSAPWGSLNVTSLVLEEGITRIGSCAFLDCATIEGKLNLPSTLREIGDTAFSGCYGLYGTLNIPSGVKEIGECAFQGCDGLTGTLNLPKGLTYIGGAAFNGCSGLTGTLVIPSDVLNIGDWTFRDCSGFTGKVVIPDEVAGIGEYAFAGCTNIEEVTIPLSVLTIETGAFSDCISITDVYYAGDRTRWNRISIGKENELLRNADIHFTGSEVLTNLEIRPVTANTLTSGSKLTLSAWDSGKKTKVKWSLSEDSKAYATISSAGVLTAKTVNAVQDITVIATPTDGSPEATRTIRILPQAKKIDLFVDGTSALSTLNPDMYERTTLDFCAVVQPEGALTQVTWSSNNPKVASVATDGTVTLLKPGTAVIKAMAADGSKVAAQVTLNVIYTDHSPKLGVSALNLNTAYSFGTTVDFVERLGNRVETVSVSDDRFDVSYENNRLTLKVQEPGLKGTYKLTLEAVCADGRTYSYPLKVKAFATLPRLTVKQTEKFNLFYQNSRAALTISGGEVEEAKLIGTNDFILEKEDGAYIIRYADPGNAPEKPDTKATLCVTFAGYNMPVTKALTISTTNAAPKIKLNPTSSILNTYLTNDWTVNPTILGTTDESLVAWSDTDGVDAVIEEGVLHVSLSSPKTTTATLYFRASGWAKSVRLTHKITVTDKKPTVKLSAKGKLDVLNPASEIVYTPKLTNATGTITDVRLEGQDANLFNAEVVDGLVHLKLAKSGENYATKKTYKVTPVVTLLGKDITAPTLRIKVAQSALKLAKLPNRTVYQSQTAPLAVKLAVTSPASAEIGDVQLNAKTTAALWNALENAGGIQADEATVSFPAKAFAPLKPGRYTVILDVTPSNAATDTKPTQARFTLTVQK